MKIFKAIMFLKSLPGYGNAKVNRACESLGKDLSLERVIDFARDQRFSKFDIESAKDIAENAADQISECSDFGYITPFGEGYPHRLYDLGNAKPAIIFAKGDKTLLQRDDIVGIVGTRNPEESIIAQFGNTFSPILDEKRPVVLSGLAKGCDTFGHQLALNCGCKTIAVLPCGFSRITPKANNVLADKIVENGGLLISEYLPDFSENRYSPVQRDAIIAALSERIVSIQCGVKSGTMHTISKAHELKRIIAWFQANGVEIDAAGHKEIETKYNGIEIRYKDDVNKFFDKKSQPFIYGNQISMFGS